MTMAFVSFILRPLMLLFAILPRIASAENNLIAFVGEKLSVEQFEPNVDPGRVLMDVAFKARYRVLDVVYGDFKNDLIDFEAYDHYGRPAFEKHKFVFLFVSKHDGRFFHQKYQYFPVFKTSSGSWAGCGSPYKFEPEQHRGAFVSRDMSFTDDAYFEVRDLTPDELAQYFPRAHYDIRNGRAYCKMGNPVSELFEVKKQGVLKARGFFR